jgi:site-specific recombinase XerC
VTKATKGSDLKIRPAEADNLPVISDAELVKLYDRDQRRRGLASTTLEVRRYHLALFLKETSPTRFSQHTPESIKDWLDVHMAETERKAAKRTKTQSHATLYKRRYWWLSVLSCFYDWAVEAGYLRNNPVRRVHRPRLKRMLPRPIPDAELSSALRQADPQMRCWLLLGALAGLRCQEMAGLDREDILEAEGLIRGVHGKGGHERMVPLHAQVLGALVALPMPPAGALFRRKMGGRFDASRVSHEVNLFLHGLGITSTAHTLRHFFGTKLYAGSHDLRLTQEMLGHQSPTTTAIYTAFDRGSAAEAVRALQIGGSTGSQAAS